MDTYPMDEILKILPTLAPYFSALVAAIPFVWLMTRSRSMFPLRWLLWRMSHRKDTVGDEWLKRPIEERIELVKMRALLVWADSYKDARELATWAAERDIDLGTLGECRWHFDRDKRQISPKLWTVSSVSLLSTLLIYAACVAATFGGILAAKDEAMVWLKSNGHGLYLTESSVRPFHSRHYVSMHATDCAGKADPAGLNEDREVACEMLADPHLSAAVRETLVGQRVFGISICVLALFLACFGPFWTSTVRSAQAVRRLIERYDAKHPPERAECRCPCRVGISEGDTV